MILGNAIYFSWDYLIMNTINKIAENLNKTWDTFLQKIIYPDNSWKHNREKCSEIQKKLLYFNSSHLDTEEHIDKTIKAMTRGLPLIQSAIEWQEPRVGKKSHNKFDRLRGNQWRLVIVYSGFEITVKALLNSKTSLNSEIIEEFFEKCDLPNYKVMGSPNPHKRDNLDKWLQKEEGKIADFLGVRGADIKIINFWIFNQNPIASWENSFQLAKALRNASAHGFLLPKKVKDWGLEKGLLKLADDLGVIIACALQKLI